MKTIRVRCIIPPPPHPCGASGYPLIRGHLPTIADCYVNVVNEDGSESLLAGVTGIRFEAAQDNRPTRLILEVVGTELDLLLPDHCVQVADGTKLGAVAIGGNGCGGAGGGGGGAGGNAGAGQDGVWFAHSGYRPIKTVEACSWCGATDGLHVVGCRRGAR